MIKRVEDKQRGEQRDGRMRCNSTYDLYTFELLDTLAMAIGIPTTTLQSKLVKYCLQNENMVNYIQSLYKRRARFRIIPSKLNGEIQYIIQQKKPGI
jgi:hypothetical protein